MKTNVEVWLDDQLLRGYYVMVGGYLATERGMKREALLAAIDDGLLTRETAARAKVVCKNG